MLYEDILKRCTTVGFNVTGRVPNVFHPVSDLSTADTEAAEEFHQFDISAHTVSNEILP